MSFAGATPPDIHIFDSPEEVARAAALRFAELARAAIEDKGSFNVALAGGSTPKRVYELLAGEEFRDALHWADVHVFFGDERCVTPDDPESNYRMANDVMLSRLPIPPENVHRMEGRGDATANARLYADDLRGYFGDNSWPDFDLVLLGMGDDGHTASLFPDSTALNEQSRWVVANWAEKLKVWRITLTAPAINHARHVVFIVTGTNKAARLRAVLEGELPSAHLPAQLISPIEGTLDWFVDLAAAAHLQNSQDS